MYFLLYRLFINLKLRLVCVFRLALISICDSIGLRKMDSMTLPKKLKKDALLEVVCEIRFDTKDYPEVAFGKLAALPMWKDYSSTRFGVADVPAPIRMQDEKLKYQALMQFTCPENKIAVKVGSNVLSYNNIREYKGWDVYFLEIQACLKEFFSVLSGIQINRIGLRYINALNASDHFIKKMNDLNFDVSIDGKGLEKFNLNYIKEIQPNYMALTRISTPDLVVGLPEESIALVDIDIGTLNASKVQNYEDVINWLNTAHDIEKKEFFSLIPDDILKLIKEN